MTSPVGSIKLDLTIDGSRVPTQVAAAAERAVGPLIATLERRLNSLERDVRGLGRETERSAAKQTAALGSVERGVHEVGDEYTKLGAKAAAASGLSTRSLNATTRALQRQSIAVKALAADYTALAAAQTSAAAAPTPGGPSRGGDGGGSGGGGRGGRGGFGGRGGGLLSGPSGAAIFNAGALAVGNIPAATTAVVGLVGAIQQLIQAGGVLPGVFAGGVASIGTAALGFKGMGDAVKALNEAAASGDPKDLEKATAALKDMDPAAAAAAKSVSRFTQGPLKDLTKSVQGKMFAGIDAEIDNLANKTMPTLTRGTAEVGSAWNKTFKEIGRVGGLDSSQSILDKIFGNTAQGQERANAAIGPLVHAFGTLTAESSDFLPRLGDGLAKLSTRFDSFITRSAQNGNLDKWINQGIEAGKSFGNTLLNVGKIITDITKAAGGDGGFLKLLENSTGALRDLTSSPEGQEKMAAFFKDGREQLQQWLPILQNLGPVLVDIYQASRQWSDILMPFLREALGALDKFPGLVQTGVTAFLAYKTLSPFVGLLGSLAKVDSAIGGISTKLGSKGGGGVLGKLGLMGAALALPAVIDAISDVKSGEAQKPSAARSASLIAGGAAIGAQVAGAPGAAVGAGIGAGVAVAPVLINGEYVDPKKIIPQGQLNSGFTPEQLNRPAGTRESGGVAPPKPAIETPDLDPTIGQQQRYTSAVQGTIDKLNELRNNVQTLPGGEVVLKDNTPEAIQRVKDLGLTVTNLPTGQVQIAVQYTLNGRPISLDQLRAPIRVDAAVPGDRTNPLLGGRASGGVLPGYSPGVDNMLVPMSGGEGVIIPEAMRALGGRWLYNLNSRFRSGISPRGYAEGGVVGADALGGDSVLGLLTQIRDLLAGKQGGPISDTATAVGSVADATTVAPGSGQAGTVPGRIGPFGTPLKARNPGYEMAAAAIQALGGDPEKFLGPDPTTYFAQTTAGAGGVGPSVLAGPGAGRFAGPLADLARTGNLGADLTGLGLDANDPVIKAIISARNKKKGGLGDDDIAALVEQVLTGGGYTGVLNSSNSSLISSLQTFTEKQSKPLKIGGRGSASVAGSAGVPMTSLGSTADAVIALAQSSSGGQYSFGASDLAKGLSDCSGAVSDLVELITKGQAGPGRLFSTANAGSVLTSLGAVPGLVPGALQIGFKNGGPGGGHMAATLPNGVNFESGGGTGQGATYGGNATGAADPQFTDRYSLLVGPASMTAGGGLAGAGANPLGYSGSPVPVYIVGGPNGAGGGLGGDLLSSLIGAGGDAAKNVGLKGLDAVLGVGKRPLPDNPLTTEELLRERNPAILAAALGIQVGDYSRQGGDSAAKDATTNAGPDYLPTGEVMSNTAALMDRTLTSMEAAEEARHQQLLDILSQVRDQLSEAVLRPIIESAVSSALQSAQAAASSAIPKAAGGPIWGGVPGRDSVPILAMPGEHMLTVSDVNAMGGHAGVYAFRKALHGAPGFATGGAVIGGKNVNDIVGAEFFGVSQVPILGAIVNIIVGLLLALIGVQIEARNTLQEATGEIRQFRGDFQAFDASGRLLSDTSGLTERSSTSEQEAADERIRILKIVISELIKFIFQQIVIPITKAVANTAIQAGAAAAGAAINSQAPGAGSIVSGLISSAGTAAVDVGTDLWGKAVDAITPVATDIISELIRGLFPNFINDLFSGKWFGNFGGGIKGGSSGGLGGGGLAGGLATAFAGMAAAADMSFDSGGMAYGKGLMFKDVIKPERVLNPAETQALQDLPAALREFARASGNGERHVHVAQQIYDSGRSARDAADDILDLVGR